MQRPATPHSHLGTLSLGYLYMERIVLDALSRQDGQGCRKVVWPPEKSFTFLEPKPAGYDLQEHGEIQDGICVNCLSGCL